MFVKFESFQHPINKDLLKLFENIKHNMEILDEIRKEDDEKEQTIGYFLRSKRRKLDNEKEDVTLCQDILPEKQRKRKSFILNLPTEILRHIFKLIPLEELGCNIRLVNRRMKSVSEDIMNTSFNTIEKKINNLLRSTIEALQAAQEDMEIKCFCRLINMLEIVDFQQRVIKSTIWRYTLNNRYSTYKSCMYAGLLLDMYEQFLWNFTHSPDKLYVPVISRDYLMPTEVTNIIHMTKVFCLHFEKTNEELVNDSLMVSGCKMIDLFDAAAFAQKDVIFENVKDDVFTARYNYFFNNAWFVALNIHSEKQMTWKQRQRMMHMRIRRILLAHTEMFMQQCHYEREQLLRNSEDLVRIRKPSNNVYTGYGDIQDKFFFYGVMNDGAYIQKFHPDDNLMNEDDIDALIDGDPDDLDINFNISEDSESNDARAPYLGLHIDVKVSCPLSHAPIRYLEDKYPSEDIEETSSTSVISNEKEKFSITLQFQCPGAAYPRLPTTYLYKFKHT